MLVIAHRLSLVVRANGFPASPSSCSPHRARRVSQPHRARRAHRQGAVSLIDRVITDLVKELTVGVREPSPSAADKDATSASPCGRGERHG